MFISKNLINLFSFFVRGVEMGGGGGDGGETAHADDDDGVLLVF